MPSPALPRVAATLLPLLLLSGCFGLSQNPATYSGTIEAVEVDVVAEVSGKILQRPVDQGDAVEAGTVIATIDPEPYRTALAEAEAALEGAEAQLALLASGFRREEVEAAAREVDAAQAQLHQIEARLARVEALRADQIISAEEIDVARRDRDVASARLGAARQRLALLARGHRPEEIQQAHADVSRAAAARDRSRLDLDRTVITSPLKGTVTEKLREPGEYVTPGAPIVSVADLVNLYTWVYLSEVDLPKLHLGQKVSVRVDAYPGRDFRGEVVYVSSVAEFTPRNVQTAEDRVQLVFGVKVAVTNPDGALKAGIPADVLL